MKFVTVELLTIGNFIFGQQGCRDEISSPALQKLRICNDLIQEQNHSNGRLEAQKDAELADLREENLQLKKRLESLEKLASKLNQQNNNLRASNRVITRRYDSMKKHSENLKRTLSSTFHADQITAMSRRSTQGMKWEPETLKYALILKMKCGTAGYEEVRKKLPYPCARTLTRKVADIKFESGILDEVFDMILAFKKNLTEEELECMLAMDEMSIDPSLVVDPSTKQVIGGVTLKSHEGTANKVLVFVLGGIATRWK